MKTSLLISHAAAILLGWQAWGMISGPNPSGTQTIRLLSPDTIEVTWIVDWPEGRVDPWKGEITNLLDAASYSVNWNEKPQKVEQVGIRRIPTYADGHSWDLRVGTSLYLKLGAGLPEGGTVEVQAKNPRMGMPARIGLVVQPTRENPALHISYSGYQTGLPKRAFAGYYLGSMGELEVPTSQFFIIDAKTGAQAFQGTLIRRPDHGLPGNPYQEVWEANFSQLDKAGTYCLAVPGMGISELFRIGPETGAMLARSYALGLLEQRCGLTVGLPFTRFAHDPCHTPPAAVPTADMPEVQQILKLLAGEAQKRHGTNIIETLGDCLYPYDRTGSVDVSGGHHDAGDYSKYTQSASFMAHFLLFAVDSFPGVAKLDNLGIPESGDGISDLLQEAKIEADYLTKLQDTDGGFYAMVYPRDRRYEGNVLPEDGDPQVVYPKTTTAAAAAVALLAQASSSPSMKAAYPKDATRYRRAALKGWGFLERAFQEHGQEGACQQLGQLGIGFRQRDALAWAYAELYIATGDPLFHEKLKQAYTPGDKTTILWGWQRLYGGFGCATRSYAFAARAGKLPLDKLDPHYLDLCRKEIVRWGRDLSGYAADSAYGTSYPEPSKRQGTVGWYFSSGQAFDIAVARELDPSIGWDAIMSNLGYESGCNPVNQCYITGLGSRREAMVVSQYAACRGRQLPPTGLPVGNIVSSLQYSGPYKGLLPKLCYPHFYGAASVYPMYDRYVDTWNTSTEQVGADQSRALAVSALLMARSPLANQPWAPPASRIELHADKDGRAARCSLISPVNLTDAQPFWESFANKIGTRKEYEHKVVQTGVQWVEAEFLLPDGRRICAATNFPGEAPADSTLPTVKISAERRIANMKPKGDGIIRISRTGDMSRDLGVGFKIVSGAVNGVDVQWLQGTHYNAQGRVSIKSGADHVDIPVKPKATAGNRSAKELRIELQPGPYNIAYPGSAKVQVD